MARYPPGYLANELDMGRRQQKRNNKPIENAKKVGFVGAANANGMGSRQRQASMALRLNNLAILAALTLAGCGAMPNIPVPAVKERNDFKGQPLSAVTARLGWPTSSETVNGQKYYYWRIGTAMQECRIRVVMAGEIIDAYETFGDSPICGPYEARAN
jgi:hypothetical protein